MTLPREKVVPWVGTGDILYDFGYTRMSSRPRVGKNTPIGFGVLQVGNGFSDNLTELSLITTRATIDEGPYTDMIDGSSGGPNCNSDNELVAINSSSLREESVIVDLNGQQQNVYFNFVEDIPRDIQLWIEYGWQQVMAAFGAEEQQVTVTD